MIKCSEFNDQMSLDNAKTSDWSHVADHHITLTPPPLNTNFAVAESEQNGSCYKRLTSDQEGFMKASLPNDMSTLLQVNNFHFQYGL